eukprot:g8102.t1
MKTLFVVSLFAILSYKGDARTHKSDSHLPIFAHTRSLKSTAISKATVSNACFPPTNYDFEYTRNGKVVVIWYIVTPEECAEPTTQVPR